MNGRKSNWILNILLVLLVLALGLGIVPAFLGAVNPSFQNTWYGFRPYIVVSDSMYPTIEVGALVIGRVTPFADLEYRDIITFNISGNGDPILNTHRIVQRETYQVITQGDNPSITMPDAAPVTQYNFRYRVVWYSNTIQLGSASGILLFVVLPAGVLLLLAIGLVALVTILRRKRNNTVPLALPEYPTDEAPQDDWLATPGKHTDVEQGDLYDLIDDDDDSLLAMLDNVLAKHNNKEEHEWFDNLMRQKGIPLPH